MRPGTVAAKKSMEKTRTPIWSYLRSYKFNSMLFRYFLIIVLLVILPNILLSVLYRYNANSTLQTEIGDANLNSLYRSSGMIENVMTELYGFAYNLSVSQDCLSFVYSDQEEIQSSDMARELNDAITFYTNTYDYVDSIYVYSERAGLLAIGRSLADIETFTDKTWLPTYQSMGENNFVVESRRRNDYYPYLITLICPIHSGRTQTVGAVVVNVDIEGIGKLIGSNRDATQQMYIVDDALYLYYSSNVDIMDHADAMADFLSFLVGRNGNFSEVMRIKDSEMIVSSVYSERYAWRYVLLSSLSVYEEKLSSMNRFMLTVTIVTTVISLIIAYYLTIKSFEPVRRIINIVENPTPFSKEYIDPDHDGNEIQHITSLVRKSQMMNSRLTMELEERMKKLNNAQLRALQGQIDPHFLYNTLDTIHWMAYEELGGENKVSQMIVTLAQLLRVNFQRASYLVTVREEVEHAKLYVRILEFRYRDRLQVSWDIDEGILDGGFVKLSIQPLVENALHHGLKARRYKGNIVIAGRLVDGNVVISVEDDGVGMDETEIDEMNGHLTNDYELDDSHIGIRNVNQRIKILFGEPYGVHIASRSGGGLIVTITVPWDQQQT